MLIDVFILIFFFCSDFVHYFASVIKSAFIRLYFFFIVLLV